MQVCYKEFTELCNNDFEKESILKDYIINNILLFTKDILEDDLISFEVEKPIVKQFRLSPRSRRIDLFVKAKNNNYIIELKNPKCSTENRAAIGQLLDYGRELENCVLVLITTKFDIHTHKTIKYYNLPIRYIYLDKKKCLECVGDDNG